MKDYLKHRKPMQGILFLPIFIAGCQLVSGLFFNGIRMHERALLGYETERTNATSQLNCILHCQATLSCFSINMHYPSDHVITCELNNNTYTQRPNALRSKPGYEYFEFTDMKCLKCSDGSCIARKALPDDWYQLNDGPMFKIFPPKSWNAAKVHCESLGAEIASITSELENKFVYDTLVAPPPPPPKDDLIAAYYKLDGSDDNVRLYGGAEYQLVDGAKALLLNGATAYATVPAFHFRTTSFTFSMWVRPIAPIAAFTTLFGDWSIPMQFRFFIEPGGKICTYVINSHGAYMIDYTSTTSLVSANTWNHVVVIWDRPLKTIRYHVNGVFGGSKVITENNVDFAQNDHTVYDIGYKRDSNQGFINGYVRDLVVTRRDLKNHEIQRLYNNGVWIGLNDETTEGTVTWADGKPLTYSKLETATNSPEADCASMLPHLPYFWHMKPCDLEMRYICRKN
ncbi:uncharacterized protein LOC116619644 [Nematostella vectensis]|uniref:uncharacterized protein LOC116619644 n=1 Tax=Nematostella vectensis TaxID=45351 RepID=UPI002077687A|nr:uncharacterized protein LOC116619644 [Nematostella vectensis]